MHRPGRYGFTLIEAAVAIAVVAILAGIIVPLVVKNIQDSQTARAKNDVQVIVAAVASQVKDTGCRPSAATGAAAGVLLNVTGAGAALWTSGGDTPVIGNITFTTPVANTFTALFTPVKTDADINNLFGTTSGGEFSYKGPYMATDTAAKVDPWGTNYLIAGYNLTGQNANGPIWVVCAGPDKSVLAANVDAGAGVPAASWNQTSNASSDDIVLRVN